MGKQRMWNAGLGLRESRCRDEMRATMRLIDTNGETVVSTSISKS